jgi:Tol biopolymer transport system component/DNA-binding winged helix-turn-helix (wHTH) protein
MPENRQSVSRVIRFGPFDADLQTQELRKRGIRIRVPGQSFQILKMLLQRHGDLVTRDELRQALWPADTFVDFDHGLSAAVNRLRDALGDSAEEPRFIETLPRRGYRFIGAITPPPPAPAVTPAETLVESPPAFIAEINKKSKPVWTKGEIIASLLAVTLCSLLAVFAYWKWRDRPQFPSLTPVPFTALPGFAGFPAISPDGSRIAFAWSGGPVSASKGPDLYVKVIGNENLLRLTNRSSGFLSPAWSPDGTQIAFHRLSKDDGGIYVVPAQGGPEKKLLSTHASSGRSINISWSPDGKSIAFSDSPISGGQVRLHLLSLETMQSTQIEHDENCLEEVLPVFSPDGKHLAYACFPSLGDFALSIATAAGASPRVLKGFRGWVEGLEWTADNKNLLFSHDETGSANHLSLLTIANGSVRDLSFGQEAEHLTVSARSGRMAYSASSGGNNNIWRADLLHLDTPPVKWISTTRDQAQPQYSPDGKHIAFTSDRGGAHEIWMSDADGTNIVQLSTLNPAAGTPRWSPTSDKIVFDSRTRTPNHADLYIVDIVERVPRKLTLSTGDGATPSWSHDGKWIYFAGGVDDARGEKIYRVPPEGGRAQVVTSARGYYPIEAFEGQSVYFAVHTGSSTTLQVASLNPTGTELPVAGMPPLTHAMNWTVVRDGIYFFPAGEFQTLSFFDLATKQARALFKTSGPVFYGTSVSPDGRYILYAQIDDVRSDIKLVENFR